MERGCAPGYGFHVEQRTAPALNELLAEALSALALPGDRAEALAQLAELVARWADRLNLTGHRGPEAIARRLVADAIALGAALGDALPASVADLGSGAGFPGLPLAIVWPAAQLTLVDSRERRHHFQRTAIRSLGLRNAAALRGRAEEIPAVESQVVLAQAMAQPAVALEWMRRWAAPGGLLVLPQSEGFTEPECPSGIERLAVRRYVVPLGGPTRAIWIGRRTAGDG